ncbi:3-carboxy-cis,cis-muconate cycloisomerase [Nocardia goodfellowii]|uniref:3-carboxy-cis,cis-muconate cycloisomerase n=1 Tax=Nocardia goodfellowii TaxID=882446 RepID=A0ABS4QRQ1_9NOCA|nr:3-carboxy-cis,cis-muconate cycloisomerase [Nocardia goodfellowii]MBP2193301.1 3-carboxy-cis,cis-muconate cycloisomerase [Nocardia goodfellowii]
MSRAELFDPLFGADTVAAAVSDRAWLTALLDVEAALARAQASVGVLEPRYAQAIDAAARKLAGTLDPEQLGREAVAGGNPVIPLVRHLRAQCPEVPGDAVHRGATSQDIIDSALMLIARRSGSHIQADLAAAADAAATLARTHRDTAMAARTLGQQALPTTFGALAAGWCAALDRARRGLTTALSGLPVQFGGAAGTLAAQFPDGLAVADALAAELGLARQGVPWHTDRVHIGELAAALGVAAGAAGKVATDIIALSATELGEVREDSPGGSSAMPHKRNAVAAITARAAARRVPGLVATALGAMDHELQRAAGPWHAEWETITDLLRLTGGTAHRLAHSLTGLHVHPDAMARNLSRTGGLLLAERVTTALAAHTDNARDIVTAAATAEDPDLAADPRITEHLSPAEVRELLDPTTYLGHAPDIVDRVLATRGPQGQQ